VLLEKEFWTSENGLMTASNKLNRQTLRARYLDKLQAVYDEVDTTEMNRTDRSLRDLKEIVKQTLNINDEFQDNNHFLELGGDSLTAIKLSSLVKVCFWSIIRDVLVGKSHLTTG